MRILESCVCGKFQRMKNHISAYNFLISEKSVNWVQLASMLNGVIFLFHVRFIFWMEWLTYLCCRRVHGFTLNLNIIGNGRWGEEGEENERKGREVRRGREWEGKRMRGEGDEERKEKFKRSAEASLTTSQLPSWSSETAPLLHIWAFNIAH